MTRIKRDLQIALRSWRRTPGVIAAVILSLALAIGANTAIFSLIDTLWLRPLPVRDPQGLVQLGVMSAEFGFGDQLPWVAYQHFRQNNRVLSALVATAPRGLYVSSAGRDVERLDGAYVSGDFFGALGLRPAAGRLLDPADDRAGAAHAAVVSWRYWNSRLQGDPAALGKQIVVLGTPVTVVGVAPREFFGLQVGLHHDMWLPLAMEPLARQNRANRAEAPEVKLIGRLKPGVSVAAARAELTGLAGELAEAQARANDDPATAQRLTVEPAGGGVASRLLAQMTRPLAMLMAGVAALLLIACANVAGLLLARGFGREREMAVRVAIGAGRFELARQPLIESLALAGAGSLLGLALAAYGTRELVRILMSGRERLDIEAGMDATVLLYTAGVAVLAAVLFGLAPAVRAWRCAAAPALRTAGRGGETRARRKFGQGLVAAQVALSMVLLSAAGLFVRHLLDLHRADLGFDREGVTILTLDPAGRGYNAERLAAVYRDLLARFDAIPGVRSATLLGAVPISGGGAARHARVEGAGPDAWDQRFLPINWVAPRYFETLGTPLLAGRDFRADDVSHPRVAIVNRKLADHYFPGGNPIGRRIWLEGHPEVYEIAGLVGDAKYQEIREELEPTIYLHAFQERVFTSQFALRTDRAATGIAAAARRAAGEVLPTVPVSRVTTLGEVVDASIVPERLVALLSGVFGAMGAVLAAAGLFALLAYSVARRTNEIGVRMALGASRGDVTRMVLGEALATVAVGLAVGVPAAVWGQKLAASAVVGLPASSAFPLAFGAAAMIAVALAAAYVPARRAARVDPMTALRTE